MQVIQLGGWVFYLSSAYKEIDRDKCGKWMYFFGDRERAEKICKSAINQGVVSECKHTDGETGVACFYLNGDDIKGHKKVIQFFIDNDLIRRTKSGKLYNISFKYDSHTGNGEYGKDFIAEIKLDKFIDLNTEKWKI